MNMFEVKVKFSLVFFKLHAMKTYIYGVLEVCLHTSLTSALGGVEWLAWCPGRTYKDISKLLCVTVLTNEHWTADSVNSRADDQRTCSILYVSLYKQLTKLRRLPFEWRRGAEEKFTVFHWRQDSRSDVEQMWGQLQAARGRGGACS
jgi:hypothetical protein